MFPRNSSSTVVCRRPFLWQVVLLINVTTLLLTIPSGVSSSSIARRQAPSGSPPVWYAQPKSHANQFLLSHLNDNQVIVPKGFTRSDDDDEEQDLLVARRALFASNGAYASMKKRKQLTKPPMEVMNEIVNSIYLKR